MDHNDDSTDRDTHLETKETTTAKALEQQLKNNLRLIHALVANNVDIHNVDHELAQRLVQLNALRNSTSSTIADHNDPEESEQEPSRDVKAEFVFESVNLLADLESILLASVKDRELNDSSNDKELLGLMDQRMIYTMLEIVVCWGIYPCLIPGVGMPLNRRVRSNIVQNDLFSAPENNTADKPVDRIESTNRLWEIIEPLARITVAYSPKVTRFTTLGSILAGRHVSDLYAALLQLAYRPMLKPKIPTTPTTEMLGDQATSTPKATKITPGSLLSKAARTTATDSIVVDASSPERRQQLVQKEESAKLFNDLFWHTEAARSLESLTILLSASPLHPAPVWLKSVCGRFLSQILLKPGGVRVVLEYMQGNSETVKLDHLEKVARLVTSVPDQMESVQEYYRIICPELLEILDMGMGLLNPRATHRTEEQKRMTPPNPQLVQTATFVVGRLLTKNPAICQVEIVAHEMEPLWRWGTQAKRMEPVASDTVPRMLIDQDDSGMDPLVASEYEVTKAVMFLYGFLVGNEPSPPLFQAFLSQAALGLYQFYEFTCQIRSILREKAKEILVVYLRILDPKETVEVLKSIVMRRRMPVSPLKPWQNQGPQGNVIQDLVDMGSVGEAYFAPGPTGGAVLRRRREVDRSAASQLELDVDIFLDFMSGLETAGEITGDLYMYLLDEYQAGKARGSNAVSPRRMLTMLQLILSMTQKLGPSIMSKVTQIIGLANNILEHQVADVEPVKEMDEEDAASAEQSHEDDSEADMEILGLVLTLLSAILNENEHLSQQDRHLLAMTLIHIQQLANHPLIEIRRVAHDLQTLIPTRLQDSSSKEDDAPKKTEMEIEMEKYASALAALQDSLLPVRAHGLHILREMILAKSIVLTRSERELDHALDIFVQHVQEPDSFIYLNAVKGLAALTDAHGPVILKKLMRIYANEDGMQTLDTRLRVGEALVQTVQRCGEALGGYTDALLPGLYAVMNTKLDPEMMEEQAKARQARMENRQSDALLTPEERAERRKKKKAGQGDGEDEAEQKVDSVSLLRSSALTVLATAAENGPTALLPEMRFLLDWVLSILDLDRQLEVRRAATLVIVLLIRAFGGKSLYRIEGDQLKRTYRTLRYVEQVDEDPLCRAQARAGIADLDAIVRMEMGPSGRGESGSMVSGLEGLIGHASKRSGGGGVGEIRYK